MPAYVIFHDGTLREIATQAPANLDALASIDGIRATKLERYGSVLLNLLRQANIAPARRKRG